MTVYDNALKRRSIRTFTNEKIGDEVYFARSFDYKFDTIVNGRFVLTNNREELVPYNSDKSLYDYIELYLWISDSCQDDDITKCVDSRNQNEMLAKTVKGRVTVELSGDVGETLIRSSKAEVDLNSCKK